MNVVKAQKRMNRAVLKVVRALRKLRTRDIEMVLHLASNVLQDAGREKKHARPADAN